MTETTNDVALAAAAQARGEAAKLAHNAKLENMEATIAGSETFVDQPFDSSAAWPTSSVAPMGESPPPSRSPNVMLPTDNTQSQP